MGADAIGEVFEVSEQMRALCARLAETAKGLTDRPDSCAMRRALYRFRRFEGAGTCESCPAHGRPECDPMRDCGLSAASAFVSDVEGALDGEAGEAEFMDWVMSMGGPGNVREAFYELRRVRAALLREELRGDRLRAYVGRLERKLSERKRELARLKCKVRDAVREHADGRTERAALGGHRALDADGAEIRVGDTVYEVKTGDKFVVETIYSGTTEPDFPDHTVRCHKPGDITAHMFIPDMLTHRAPVIAADGKLLREGEHVYHVETGAELVVKELPKPGAYQAVVVSVPPAGHLTSFDPDQLTHERPEIDSWQRLEEDAGRNPFDYCKEVGHRLDTCENSEAYKALDIVRRAKALAGVSE